jgi:hypothetical protein
LLVDLLIFGGHHANHVLDVSDKLLARFINLWGHLCDVVIVYLRVESFRLYMYNFFDLPGCLFQLAEGFQDTLLSSTFILLWEREGLGFGRLIGELGEWGQEQG